MFFKILQEMEMLKRIEIGESNLGKSEVAVCSFSLKSLLGRQISQK